MRCLAVLTLLTAPALADNGVFTSQVVPSYRGAVGARYDLYDTHLSAAFGAPNAPDPGPSYASTELVQHDPGAILLGSDYIYGLGGPADYSLLLHNQQTLREISLQIRVEGIPLDNTTVALRWNDASGNPLALKPQSTVALNPSDPNEQQFIWSPAQLAGLDTTDAELVFTASGAHMGLDVIVLDLLLEHGGLASANDSISLTTGGSQTLQIDGGLDAVGALYFIAGSLHGTAPGTPYQTLNVPLTFDAYTLMTINQANTAMFQNTLGLLDGNGLASATLNLPPGLSPALVGLHVDHAALLFDPVTLGATSVSAPLGLDLTL